MTDHNSNLIRMRVTGLTIDPFSNMPIIILKDESENIAMPIWIGLIEASAIATELEKVPLTRPMTHDLFKTVLDEVGVQVVSVEITELTDNTFFSLIKMQGPRGEMTFDCRPSDALAMAIRTSAPVLVHKKVIEKSRQLSANQPSIDQLQNEKWSEILENLTTDDFGKYKM